MDDLQDLINQRNSLERQLENCQFKDNDMIQEYDKILTLIAEKRESLIKDNVDIDKIRELDVQSFYPACMMKGDE